MHRKLDHRVSATPAARLSLAALFVCAWNGTPGVSTPLKPTMVAGGTDNDELLGNLGRSRLFAARLIGSAAGYYTLSSREAWKEAA